MGDFPSGLHGQLFELLGFEGICNCLFEQLFKLFDEIGFHGVHLGVQKLIASSSQTGNNNGL